MKNKFMEKVIKLNFDQSLGRINWLKNEMWVENKEMLDEIIEKIPKTLWESSKDVISTHINRLIRSILFFWKLYKKTESKEFDWVIREVIISFRYDIKHCLKIKI